MESQTMAKSKSSSSSKQLLLLFLVSSVALNLYFGLNRYVGSEEWSLSWTKEAALEAERVAALTCSGRGRAYLDGLVTDDGPTCECFTCYGGPDCSHFSSDCIVDANGGDPLFLEPFWMERASRSAVVVAGWHRMSYKFEDDTFISRELERHIRMVHAAVGNAVADGKYIVFGSGSTQLLNAAVHALSPDNASSPPASVVATTPFYPVYRMQTDYFASDEFKFEGDTSMWKNTSDGNTEFVEFVTSPNNPDGQLKQPVLDGPNVKTIYDMAYYWPHYTPIPATADGNVMLFTLSKLTGHAGSRFGWGLIRDEDIYKKMDTYLRLNTMGVSRESQLRTLKLLKVVLEDVGRRKDIFRFGYDTMKKRWERLNHILSTSARFSLQKIPPRYCIFFNKVRHASPAYAWVKCEKEEDSSCYEALKAGNIIGREGSLFGAEDRYVRLSILRSHHDFDLLADKFNKLVMQEEEEEEEEEGGGPKTI